MPKTLAAWLLLISGIFLVFFSLPACEEDEEEDPLPPARQEADDDVEAPPVDDDDSDSGHWPTTTTTSTTTSTTVPTTSTTSTGGGTTTSTSAGTTTTGQTTSTTTTTDPGTTTTGGSTTTTGGSTTTTGGSTTTTGGSTTTTTATTTTVTTTSSTTTTTLPFGVLWMEDLEDDPLGPLGHPWDIISVLATTAEVTALFDGPPFGRVLKIDGWGGPGEHILINYPFVDVSQDLWVEFHVLPFSTQDEFGFRLMKAHAGVPYLSAELGYWEEALHAWDAWDDEWVNCGIMYGATWNHVQVRLEYGGDAFSVWINGFHSSCNGLLQYYDDLDYPFGFFQVIDWGDLDFDGMIMWDNFLGRLPD